jgi:hypothetical protein
MIVAQLSCTPPGLFSRRVATQRTLQTNEETLC